MARSERERRRHRPLTAEGLKKRENQQGGAFDALCKDEFRTFRAKEGSHTVRFFEGTWPDAEHWAHDTWIHNQIGPDNGRYFCLQKMLNQPCPLCDERRALQAAGETEAAKAIAAKRGACAWIINRDAEEDGPLLWFYGQTVDKEFASRCRNRKTGALYDIIDPEEGNDFFFKVDGKGTNTKYSGFELDRDPTPLHEREKVMDRWLDFVEDNPVPDCFKFFDAEYLQNLITGSSAVKHTDDDDDEDEAPRKRRSRSVDDDDDDGPPERRTARRGRDDDDDEPVTRRRRSRDDDEDDDGDTRSVAKPRRQRDEDDDDDPPQRRRASSRDRDDDDDDPPKRSGRRGSVDDDEDEPRSRNRSARRGRDEDDDEEEEAPKTRKPRSRLNDDLDDDIPSERRGRDGDKPAARRRSRDEDDDDEPPARKKRTRLDDDEDEDVVAQGKRQLSRLKEEETGDEDDQPRKRRK
jgi:hypothetical protein